MGTGSIRRWVLKSAVGLVGLGLLPGGFAQEYPVRPVRVIVTSAPGGSADKLSRLLFSKLSEDFGQQFVIEHRPGGGGTIGPALVAQAPADGYTVMFDSTVFASTPYVKSGAIRAVAQTTTGRIEAFPDLPPVSDTLPGFAGADWLGVFLRSGTPPAVVSKLSAGLNKTLLDPGIKKQLVDLTVEFGQNTPEEFEAFVKSEAQKWGQVVRDANIRLD